MDLYEEERLAVGKAAAAAELRMTIEEGVRKGWLYAQDDEDGNRRFGLTEEGKQAMQRGELGSDRFHNGRVQAEARSLVMARPAFAQSVLRLLGVLRSNATAREWQASRIDEPLFRHPMEPMLLFARRHVEDVAGHRATFADPLGSENRIILAGKLRHIKQFRQCLWDFYHRPRFWRIILIRNRIT